MIRMGFATTCPNRGSRSPSHALSAYRVLPTAAAGSPAGVSQCGRGPCQVGSERLGASDRPGCGADRRRPVVARSRTAVGTSSARAEPCCGGHGASLDIGRCQPDTPDGAVRGGGSASLGVDCPAYAQPRTTGAAADRCHAHPRRADGAGVGGGRRRQAARRAGPHPAAHRVFCGDRVAGERHHPSQAVPDRARHDLRLRSRLLRLRLLGEAACPALPVRHPAEEEHADQRCQATAYCQAGDAHPGRSGGPTAEPVVQQPAQSVPGQSAYHHRADQHAG